MRRLPAFMLRRSATAKTPSTKHIEIWGHVLSVNRVLKRTCAAMSVICILSVGGAVYTIWAALENAVVYYVDSDGRAVHGGRLGNASVPQRVEAVYVAKQFLRKSIAFDSSSVAADLADAWNLMTDELQTEQRKELAAYERERGQSFVDYVAGQQIRTILAFENVEVEPTGDGFRVRARGEARIWPLSAVGEEAGFVTRGFEAHLALMQVERTELSPNALLVSKQATRFFEGKTDATSMEETVPSPLRTSEPPKGGGATQ